MASSGKGNARRRGVLLVAPLMSVPCDLNTFLPNLSQAFMRATRIKPIRLDLQAAYSPERNQYHSTRILLELRSHLNEAVDRMVAVVDVDLFVPVLTHVFGEAQLGGPLALVSTFRLREPWLPEGAPPSLFRERVFKTLLHELGHTVGLRHCPDYSCVMTSAASLEMLDEKGREFCLSCRAEIVRVQR